MPTSTRQRRASRAIIAVLAVLVTTTGLLATSTTSASAGQVGVTIGIRGAGQVSVVEGSIEDYAQLTCQRYDNQDHRVTVWCPRVRNSEVLEAWVWLRATPAFQPAGQWVFDRWEGCDRIRERDGHVECAVHSGAFSSDEKHPVAQFRDVVAPQVTTFTPSPVAGKDRAFTFLFHATEGVTECRVAEVLDWHRCTTGREVQVAEGFHSFQVRATDTSGNYDVRTVGVVAVDTRMTAGPPARTNDTTPTFAMSTGSGEGFWCSLDGGVWTRCADGKEATYDLPPVVDGEHRLLVQARYGTWIDAVPAEWRWTTDTVGPTTTISVVSNGSTADVTLTSPDAVRYECRIDRPGHPGTWQSCSAGMRFLGLTDGEHTLTVRGIDDVGNVESPAKVHRWTVTTTPDPDPGTDPGEDPVVPPVVPDVPVDTTPPDTVLTSGPAGFVLDPTATFQLASEPGARFECHLDGSRVGCGATLTVTGLTSGTHVLAATALDPAGNADPTPVVRTWTVPATAAELRTARGWKVRRDARAYGGRRLETTRRGATLARSVRDARQVALVVGRGKRHGTVRVYAGRRLVGTVRLAARRTTTRQVVALPAFDAPYTGRLRVVVATQGRPVRIEGLGVADR